MLKKKSTNAVMVEEIDELQKFPVAFDLDNEIALDASDSFFGKGVNGRNCIQEEDDYEDYIVDCSFQNNAVSYFTDDYLRGIAQTTGIARYVQKFNFTMETVADKKVVTLNPREETSYYFYIEFPGNVCPKINQKISTLSGCNFTLYYTGTQTAKFGESTLSFTNNYANIIVPFGNYPIVTNGKTCLVVACDVTNKVTQISLTTPGYELVSQDSLSTSGKINLISDFNRTKNNLDNVRSQLNVSISELQNYEELLKSINFSKIVTDNPFKNFTSLRADVDYLISQILNKSYNERPSGHSCAEVGVFGSAQCFFEDALSSLIIVSIIVGALIIIYVILVKRKAIKNIFKKKKGDELEMSSSDSSKNEKIQYDE